MLLFYVPTAFAASADVVICFEINGQTSLERVLGEDCASFIDHMPDANILATPQHCSECTDYMLSNSVFRTKVAPTQNHSKTPQKRLVTVRPQNIWPQLTATLSIAATPPPHKASTTLTHLRTVIIRV